MDKERRRILVVDDEAVPRNLAVRMLSVDYEVRAAASAEEALTLLIEMPADLVLTDNEMTGMTGVQLIERVLSLYPAIACMMVSGNINEERREWLEERQIPYLEKPYRMAALVERVAALLGSGTSGPG